MKNIKYVTRLTDKSINDFCKTHTKELGLDNWIKGYTNTVSYKISNIDLFLIVDYIIDRLIKSGKYSKHISWCDCDYEEFENDYDEDDIKNNKPEIMRILPLPYKPSFKNIYDYENIHIFEIKNDTTPILPETISEIAVVNIQSKISEWVNEYIVNNMDKHNENIDLHYDPIGMDIDDDEDDDDLDY